MGKTLRQIINGRKDNERVTFTTTNTNEMPNGKTQDTKAHNMTQQHTTDAPYY
jgi:hypothetical protein